MTLSEYETFLEPGWRDGPERREMNDVKRVRFEFSEHTLVPLDELAKRGIPLPPILSEINGHDMNKIACPKCQGAGTVLHFIIGGFYQSRCRHCQGSKVIPKPKAWISPLLCERQKPKSSQAALKTK